jgi:hypothetical protein
MISLGWSGAVSTALLRGKVSRLFSFQKNVRADDVMLGGERDKAARHSLLADRHLGEPELPETGPGEAPSQ